MTHIKPIATDPVINEMMELVAKVRSGEIISLTVISTDVSGNISAKKVVEPSLIERKYWA